MYKVSEYSVCTARLRQPGYLLTDTLGRLGSSEDTFTQFYVYDLKEIHNMIKI